LVETLTESFCERCGTRYEFRAPTRLNPLRKTRGIIGGLKNYLTSQDDFSDAIGDAIRSEEDQLASAQLEAFHESFNFCIDCRQYTCVNCWNDEAGRCRSCVPIAGTDDLADRLAASLAGDGTVDAVAAELPPPLAEDELQRRLGVDVWPTNDVAAPSRNGHAPAAWPTSDAVASHAEAEPFVAEVEPVREPAPTEFERPFADTEPPVVAEVEPEPVPAHEPAPTEFERPFAEPEPVVAEAAAERPLLRVMAWEADAGYDVEPPTVVAEVELEPEPEPVVAEVEPEPEPRRAPRIAPVSETILRFPTQPPTPIEVEAPSAPAAEPAAAVVDTPELAARRAQLDLLGLGDPGQGPVGPERPAVLPYRSRGAVASAAARQGASFWEASAREVAGAAGQIGLQSCGECGLSLSANARFCRRCGTRQARSA
jgi:hypothetical protein